MTKERLLQLAENFQKKAEKDYENYQATGIGRYDSSRNRNEELADALFMAASAADEHAEYLHMKYQMSEFAHAAKDIRMASEAVKQKMTEKLIRELEAYGCLRGLIRKESL